MSDKNANNVDQIRDLIFGNQIKDFEAQFNKLNDTLKVMEDKMTKAFGESHTKLQKETERSLEVLENTNVDNAIMKIEQLRKLVDTHTFKDIGHLTVSFGLAKNEESDDMHSLLFRADKALYEAKDAGKNRVIFKKI